MASARGPRARRCIHALSHGLSGSLCPVKQLPLAKWRTTPAATRPPKPCPPVMVLASTRVVRLAAVAYRSRSNVARRIQTHLRETMLPRAMEQKAAREAEAAAAVRAATLARVRRSSAARAVLVALRAVGSRRLAARRAERSVCGFSRISAASSKHRRRGKNAPIPSLLLIRGKR